MGKNLEICDQIKSRQASAKEAMRSIKRRLQHRNPNVQLLALELTDSTIKNTSHQFLKEVSSREFVDVLVGMCRGEQMPVAQRTKERFQTWAILLSEQSGLNYIKEAYEQAKREGVVFPPPPTNINRTIVKTEAPPEWTDSATCHRCNVPFGLMLRKHHCRRCGNTFCQDCSGKTISLPELGLYEEVRVCETCYAHKFESEIRIGRLWSNNAEDGKILPVIPEDRQGKDSFEEEMAKAIKLSLKESSPVIPKTTEEYDEEAALATAIAESAREAANVNAIIPEPESKLELEPDSGQSNKSHVPATRNDCTRASISMLITPIERENVQLFSELIERMNPHDEELEEPDFLQLARDMLQLKERLQDALSAGEATAVVGFERIVSILKNALLRYEQLAMGGAANDGQTEQQMYTDPHAGPPMPDLTSVPSRPRSYTGSVVYVNSTRLSADIVPILQPIRNTGNNGDDTIMTEEQEVLIPLDETDASSPSATNNDDVPLIQL